MDMTSIKKMFDSVFFDDREEGKDQIGEKDSYGMDLLHPFGIPALPGDFEERGER